MAHSTALLPAARFADISAAVPDVERLRSVYARLQTELENAAGAARALDTFYAWDALRRAFITWAALTELQFQQDTNDVRFKANADLLNAARPKIAHLDVNMKHAFLASPFRAALEAELGTYVFRRWEMDVTAFDPSIEEESVEEAGLQDRYTELLASAHFTFAGEELNLSTIGKYSEHPDRELRRQAAFTKWDFYAGHEQILDEIYDDLVRLRTGMARKLGLSSFVDLGYRRMMRIDYGPSEVAGYREEIVREIVPLAQRIVAAQARDLNVEQVMLWDEHVFSAMPPPKPPGRYDVMIDRAQVAFEGVSPDIGSFAAMMVERELLDLESREGKAGGGFCTSFPTHGLPYIFANFNGTTGDVNVLVHEMGHAFQGFASREMDVSEYLLPTYETCEVHSMSMEFLAWPQLEHFFGSDAARYRVQHLKTSLLFLPYAAAVDHFQHLVYENPDAGTQQRKALWKELEARYMPWRSYGGITHLEAGGYWQAQRHIYQMPFYYIDYALAMGCALQFWERSLQDYRGALAAYTALCKAGGRAPFQQLVRDAGLQSPFETGVLRHLARRAAAVLNL